MKMLPWYALFSPGLTGSLRTAILNRTSPRGILATPAARRPMADSETPLTFGPETLFEHINGASDLYLSYDFQELLVAYYTRKDDGAELTVEIYGHGRCNQCLRDLQRGTAPDGRFTQVARRDISMKACSIFCPASTT